MRKRAKDKDGEGNRETDRNPGETVLLSQIKGKLECSLLNDTDGLEVNLMGL